MPQCPNCGNPIPDSATVFCPNCGTKLPTPQTSTPRPQTPQAQQTFTVQPAPTYYQQPEAYPPAKPHGHELYYAIIGVLLILVIILGVVSALGFSGFIRTSHYTIANPPNAQSIQPPNWPDASPSQASPIWNACGSSGSGCVMRSTGWREGSVPDTFDYFVSFTSTVPVTVYFFTFGQFVQYSECNGDTSCVSGVFLTMPPTTQRTNTLFKLAEGCADYLAIYVATADGTMNPNISVAQNPASFPTGYCAQAGT